MSPKVCYVRSGYLQFLPLDINFLPSLKVEAVDALQTLFRAPLTPGVHPGGHNIAYDLALVKLGPHTKFGEDWSNGIYFYTGHTHKHTQIHLYI